jgi:hypothetical protein
MQGTEIPLDGRPVHSPLGWTAPSPASTSRSSTPSVGKAIGVLTQIYGLTTVTDALAVDRLGADHLGVVVDEGIATWDRVDEETAKAIARAVQHARLIALRRAATVSWRPRSW